MGLKLKIKSNKNQPTSRHPDVAVLALVSARFEIAAVDNDPLMAPT